MLKRFLLVAGLAAALGATGCGGNLAGGSNSTLDGYEVTREEAKEHFIEAYPDEIADFHLDPEILCVDLEEPTSFECVILFPEDESYNYVLKVSFNAEGDLIWRMT